MCFCVVDEQDRRHRTHRGRRVQICVVGRHCRPDIRLQAHTAGMFCCNETPK